MPRQIEFQGAVHEFPDNATDDQIRSALNGHAVEKGTHPQSFAEKIGIKNALLAAPFDALEGVGAGVMSTVRGASQIAHKVIPAIPEVPAEYAQAPDSLAGKAGKFAEQAGEFAIPGGLAAKASKGMGLLARAGAEGLAAGSVSALQTGGDPKAAAAGALAGAAGPAVGAAVRGASRAIVVPAMDRLISESPRPLSDAAKGLAQRYGVPLTRGMEGGSKTTQAIEKTLGHTVAPDIYEPIIQEGQQGVRRMANDLTGNFAVDKFAAGDNTVQRILKVAEKHNSAAQQAYGTLEAIEADPANLKTITTGMKPSAVLDASGSPAMTPVTERVAVPVDVSEGKKQLLPIRDFIKQQLPVAQQQYSKGLHAIEQFIAGPNVVPASVAEANLSALKQIQREAVDGRVKALAGKVITSLSPAVDRAVAEAGPDAVEALRVGRQSWKAGAQALDVVDSLSGDVTGKTGQVTASQRLLKPGDASYPLIKKVLDIAPDSADDLGKSLLGQIFSKAENGDVTNALTASNLWNRIGTRTKAALYTPEHMKDITAALELARRVNENPNPSGTGIINSLLKLGVLVTHPVGGGASIAAGRGLAKLLYEPEGAAALKVVLRGGPPASIGKAMSIISGIAAKSAESAAQTQPIGELAPGVAQ
jgi:hypothetical protein